MRGEEKRGKILGRKFCVIYNLFHDALETALIGVMVSVALVVVPAWRCSIEREREGAKFYLSDVTLSFGSQERFFEREKGKG